MQRVVIVGMGFGGIRAARALAGKGVEVLVIDRRNYHLFQPLLYQVATSSLEEESIAYPVRAIIRNWKGIDYRLADVIGADFTARRLKLADGEIEYDYLILAAGGATHFFGLESVERHAFELKGLSHAVRLRNHILNVFERAAMAADPDERLALLTFVVVGGGPTGVEFAGALKELIRHELSKDYPALDLTRSRILLLEARDALLPALPEKLRKYTLDKLTGNGIEVLFNAQVSGAEADRVLMGDGSSIPTHTIVWSAGVKASPLAATFGLPTAANGRIRVREDLSVDGHPEVFVIGDMAYLEQDGKPLPMVAPVAMQEGAFAAGAIVSRIKGSPVPAFRYRDKGTMATIGRSSAVAQAFGMRVSGFTAWVVWLGLHLMYLVGFRNRLMVLLNWGYYYFFRAQQVRIITQADPGRNPDSEG
jgi:NADH:ubiquinone reductase (H+-translocating)